MSCSAGRRPAARVRRAQRDARSSATGSTRPPSGTSCPPGRRGCARGDRMSRTSLGPRASRSTRCSTSPARWSSTATTPFEALATLGCAVVTGVGAVTTAARVPAGASVAVIGAGGVGLNVVQGAVISGAGKIVALDRTAPPLAFARQFGATDTVEAASNLSRGNPRQHRGRRGLRIRHGGNARDAGRGAQRRAKRWRRGYHGIVTARRCGVAADVPVCHAGQAGDRFSLWIRVAHGRYRQACGLVQRGPPQAQRAGEPNVCTS